MRIIFRRKAVGWNSFIIFVLNIFSFISLYNDLTCVFGHSDFITLFISFNVTLSLTGSITHLSFSYISLCTVGRSDTTLWLIIVLAAVVGGACIILAFCVICYRLYMITCCSHHNSVYYILIYIFRIIISCIISPIFLWFVLI